jgi:hypothetical protein
MLVYTPKGGGGGCRKTFQKKLFRKKFREKIKVTQKKFREKIKIT